MNEGTVCLSVKKEKSLALFQHLNCSVRKEKVNEYFSMAYLQWAIHNESINDTILNFVSVFACQLCTEKQPSNNKQHLCSKIYTKLK